MVGLYCIVCDEADISKQKPRKINLYKKADWEGLCNHMSNFRDSFINVSNSDPKENEHALLCGGTPSKAEQFFCPRISYNASLIAAYCSKISSKRSFNFRMTNKKGRKHKRGDRGSTEEHSSSSKRANMADNVELSSPDLPAEKATLC